jgi:hypothetical protein
MNKMGECVYCGKVAPITYDHVPPRNLFAKPRPDNLIRVPSCKECHGQNKQVSQDDEYFRNMLAMREDIFDHPDIKQILPRVLKSLARPDKVKSAKSIYRTMRKVDVRTRLGLYLGTKIAYNVNLARLDNVARRIVKGLFFHEKGHRLPDEYKVIVLSESGLYNANDYFKKQLQIIFRPLMANTPKIIGNQVFSYRVYYTYTDDNASAWLLEFYEQVRFFCMTLPN